MRDVNRVGLRPFLWSKTIFTFGRYIVEVYLPLILLYGHPLWEVYGFYAAAALTGLLLCKPCARMIHRYGLRRCFVVGYSALALYQVLLSLYVSGIATWALYALPAVLAVHNVCIVFATALHVSQAMDDEREGRQISYMQAFTQVASIIGPMVGAVIAIVAGTFWLVVTSAALMLVALYHLRHVDETSNLHVGISSEVSYRERPPWRDLWAQFSLQWHAGAAMLLWPVCLAVMTSGFGVIGIVMSVVALFTGAIVLTLGRKIDEGKPRKALRWTTLPLSISLLAVSVSMVLGAASGIIWITAASAALGMFFNAFCVPWFTSYYKLARSEGINYVLSMETAGSVSNLSLWGLLALVTVLGLPDRAGFAVAYLSAAGGVWGCMALRRT